MSERKSILQLKHVFGSLLFFIQNEKYVDICFSSSGVPKPEVIWCKDGRVLRNGYKHKMLEDAGLHMLEIRGIKLDDAAVYTCKARNSQGQAVSECKLKVVG